MFKALVVVHDDGDAVVVIRGELDLATVPLLSKALGEAIPKTRWRLVIDLRDTSFVDSTAIGIFVRACRRLRRRGAELVLSSPRSNVANVLRVSGLDRVITIET